MPFKEKSHRQLYLGTRSSTLCTQGSVGGSCRELIQMGVLGADNSVET